MKAFIFTGGTVYDEYVLERPEKDDLILSADAGLLTAKRFGCTPQIVVGDFDTLRRPDIPEGAEVLRSPAEKDDTDTQLAVQTALSRGAKEIVLIGGMEGRVDHTLSTLAVAENLWEKHIPAILTNGKNRVRFVRNSGVILLRSQYTFFSVLAVDEELKGVSLEGCKYPLKKAKINRTHQWAVSNEITGNCALIEIRRGGAFIIESMD